ncbi:MAG TPA: hypothetical protein VKA67_01125, partial [Verrucomicrobiae bacterium]|nr:hypothetical protein [Verrucomicrobiae bacterium]
AEVILTALSKFDPEFNELQVAAATRPDCRFPLEYNLELPNDILVPHFSIVKNIVLCADVRAVADLELRRNQDAFTNLNIGFRIADSVQNEPLLLSQVVRMATLEKNLQTIREGLARHAWSDAQLEELESRLSSIDLLADGRHAIRGERDSRLATLEFSRRQKWKFGYRFVNHFGGIDLGEFLFRILPDDWEDIAYRLVPYGWFYQNQLNLVRIFQNYALPAIDGDSHRVLLATIKPGLKFTYEHRLGPYHLLASRLAPEMYRTSMTIAKNQTYVDAARVACALERYRLANGYLPEKLDSLVPRYLAKIPNDVIDGQPLRYRLDSDGNYVIYSVGWNQTDDGGVRGRRSFGPNGPFVPDLEQGDWVWTLAAH